MMKLSKREILTQALIEQELASRVWEELVPNIPVEATPFEALNFARAALEKEYAVIALEDLETLYRIFIMETDVDEVELDTQVVRLKFLNSIFTVKSPVLSELTLIGAAQV